MSDIINCKPHIHSLIIKLWADGAIIEAYDKTNGTWFECTPSWDESNAYRCKLFPNWISPGEKS